MIGQKVVSLFKSPLFPMLYLFFSWRSLQYEQTGLVISTIGNTVLYFSFCSVISLLTFRYIKIGKNYVPFHISITKKKLLHLSFLIVYEWQIKRLYRIQYILAHSDRQRCCTEFSTFWLKVGQIGPDSEKTDTFSNQLSVHFGSPS